MKEKRVLSDKWLKGAVLGSIWAAFEIIAGSFLHNIRVPFAGTFLSMFSVFLLVSFIMHWKKHGIIIRAGIVAALMKSISPSAVIFGPMVAIFMEALIIESVILIFRRNLAGYMIAGALAVSWALIQKLLNFLIIYGFDVVRIAEAFYNWLVIKTGLTDLSPAYLGILIVSIYCIAGAAAALLAFNTTAKSYDTTNKTELIPLRKRSGVLQTDPFNRFNSLHLLLILLSMVGILFLTNSGSYIYYIPGGVIFLSYILIRYRSAIRHIRKPKVWLQFLLLTIIATLLWEWVNTGEYFSFSGLEAGLTMVFRALVIIFGFSAISVEFRNPFIKGILQRNGLANLYISLNLAFTALPSIISQLPQFKNLVKNRGELLHSLFEQSDKLLDKFKNETMLRNNIYILSGDVQSGKTTLISAVIDLLKKRGSTVGGITAPGELKDGQRGDIFIKDIQTGDTYLHAQTEKKKNWIMLRRFSFNPETIHIGNEIIGKALSEHADLVVIDEIGPLELRGEGWYPSMEKLINHKGVKQVWVVREKLVKEVRLNYMIPESNVIIVKDTTVVDFANKVLE